MVPMKNCFNHRTPTLYFIAPHRAHHSLGGGGLPSPPSPVAPGKREKKPGAAREVVDGRGRSGEPVFSFEK